MFYSQLLLSKKGALGTVWIAAHCYKKLKKYQVQQTDISSSVDKILDDEVPVVAHRILAYLLLGVVRIYSKKVGYLYDDCNDVLHKLCEFKIEKKSHARSGIREISRTCNYSVKLPKRFELDAFDLELLEDGDIGRRKARPKKEVMLADGRREEGSTSGLLHKDKVSFGEAHSTEYTPPRDVMSPHHMDHDISPISDTKNFMGTPETLRGTSFSSEDRMEPMVLDEAEEEEMHAKPSNEDMDNLQGPTRDIDHDSVAGPSHNRSDSLSIMDPMVLDEAENGKDPVDKNHRTEEEQMERLRSRLTFQDDISHKLAGSVDKEPPGSVEKMKFPDEATPESKKCGEHPISINVDVMKDSKNADVATVRTPAPREHRKILKKRKSMFDYALVVSNDEYKDWLNNPSDLIRKKRLAPLTPLQAWRACKLSCVPQSFLEPCISINLCTLVSQKKSSAAFKRGESLSSQDDFRSSPRHDGQEQTSEIRSPVLHEDQEQTQNVSSRVMQENREQSPASGSLLARKSPEHTMMAPETPITQLNSLRSHEAGAVAADSNILEPTSLSLGTEKPSSLSEGTELDAIIWEEETNTSNGDSDEKNVYSTRTRMVESYLLKKFLNKKRQREDEVLNLSQLLTGKTKKESARLFYEILVLKTQDCIDVQQENAYGEILLRKTSKLQ